MHVPDPLDPRAERRHVASAEPWWEEAYWFWFHADDGSVGAWLRLGVFPNAGVSSLGICVIGPGRPPVLLVEHDAAAPAPNRLELRTHGVWLDLQCDSPFEQFSVGLEAFALTVDDGAVAWGTEMRGHPTPLGFDVEWDTVGAAEPVGDGASTGYQMAARVHGVVLVGDERIDLDGGGRRGHHWGTSAWWRRAWQHPRDPRPGEELATASLPYAAPDGARSVLHHSLLRVQRESAPATVSWLSRNEPRT